MHHGVEERHPAWNRPAEAEDAVDAVEVGRVAESNTSELSTQFELPELDALGCHYPGYLAPVAVCLLERFTVDMKYNRLGRCWIVPGVSIVFKIARVVGIVF